MSDASPGSNAPPRDEVAAKRSETVAVDNKPVDAKPGPNNDQRNESCGDRRRRYGREKADEAAAASTVTNDTPKVEAKPDQQAAAGVKPEAKADQSAEERAG